MHSLLTCLLATRRFRLHSYKWVTPCPLSTRGSSVLISISIIFRRHIMPHNVGLLSCGMKMTTLISFSSYLCVLAGRRIFISFEGVDSAFYIWINGIFVGYRFVAHFPGL